MTQKKWDEILVADHEMIERAMDVLKRELERLPGLTHDAFSMARAIDFLLEFGDSIHNRKEEKYLFPLMVKRGIPEDGPIRVMLMEHESERLLLGRLAGEIKDLKSIGGTRRDSFRKQGMDYLEVRANHIWKENDVLFKMGRQVLSEKDNTALVGKFEDLTAAAYGRTADEKFAAMLSEVEKGKKAVQSLVQNLSADQIHAIMETLPFEVTFVDADDTVAYFNRLDKEKIFVRSRSVIGRKVQQCHPSKSVATVEQIVNGFKSGTLDKAEFWIDIAGDKILIRYFPVRDDEGTYMGVLEVTQAIGEIQKIKGQKRLLDED